MMIKIIGIFFSFLAVVLSKMLYSFSAFRNSLNFSDSTNGLGVMVKTAANANVDPFS